MFVTGKPFQSSLMFVGKEWSLPKWCLHRRENIKHYRYRQRWRFEMMGKFQLKLHCSVKSLDPHRVCEQTFREHLPVVLASIYNTRLSSFANRCIFGILNDNYDLIIFY